MYHLKIFDDVDYQIARKFDDDNLSLPKDENNNDEIINASDNNPGKTEKKLIKIWESVLGIKNPDPKDDFFEIGGHSLLAVQLIAAVRKTFNTEIELQEIFDASTLKGMSEIIEKKVS